MASKQMTIQKAQVLADSLSVELDSTLTEDTILAFVAAVASAAEQGWQVVEVDLTEDNVTIAPATGVMVAWMLPEYVADQLEVEGGEVDLHVTLAYLGDAANLTLEQQRTLVAVVSEVLAEQQDLWGLAWGTNTFTPSDSSGGDTPWYAEVIMPGLDDLRARLVAALVQAGLPVNLTFTDYTPHITLAYIAADQEVPQVDVLPTMLTLDGLSVCVAGARYELANGSEEDDNWWDARDAWMQEQLGQDYWDAIGGSSSFIPFVKSVIEANKRFTLGPWYIPDTVDSHGEWTDPEELQTALWDYVDSGYRFIHLQHSPDIVAGRWVEIMTLPWAITIPVIDIGGDVVGHEYPAGTVMMGVIWEPWAWQLVLDGAITGYSIGGNAFRTDEQPPDPNQPAPAEDEDDNAEGYQLQL